MVTKRKQATAIERTLIKYSMNLNIQHKIVYAHTHAHTHMHRVATPFLSTIRSMHFVISGPPSAKFDKWGHTVQCFYWTGSAFCLSVYFLLLANRKSQKCVCAKQWCQITENITQMLRSFLEVYLIYARWRGSEWGRKRFMERFLFFFANITRKRQLFQRIAQNI